MQTILIITLDPPDPSGFKGGLYPQAIRQHAELGLNVIVAPLLRETRLEQKNLASLGAQFLDVVHEETWVSQIMGLSFLERKLRCERFVGRSKAILAAARKYSPFCVLGLQSHHTGFAARRISQGLGVPYVCWEHLTGYERGVKFSRSDKQLRQLFSDSLVTAAVSESLLNTLRDRFSIELPQGRVLPNPVPEGFMKPPTAPAPEWLDTFAKGRFVFGAWTAWRQQKRLDVLLDAFSLVRAAYDDVALIVAGRISKGYCANLIANQDARHVLFPGPIPRSEVHHLAHRVNCCCISSDYETFGLPMLEALAAGRPVVSTRCAGPDSVLDDTRLGRLCDRGNVKGLAAAMIDIYEKRDQFDKITIQNITNTHFGEKAQLERWRKIYEPLLHYPLV